MKQHVTLTIVSSVIFVFGVMFSMIPLLGRIIQKQQSLVSTVDQIQQKVLLSKSLESVQRDLENVEEGLTTYKDVLVDPNAQLEAITNLEALAAQNHLAQQLQAASPRRTSDKLLSYLPLTITLAGDFDNLWPYIAQLERIALSTTIQRMTVTPLPTQEGGALAGVVSASLEVWLFLQS